jgi:very-short-patch-repair endonuclease
MIFLKFAKNASSYHRITGEILEEILPSVKIEQEKCLYIDGVTQSGAAKKLHADFFIPAYKLMIEVDGELHYKPGFDREKSYQNLKHRKTLDNRKDYYAIQNGWNILRIPYWEFKDKNNVKDIIIYKINSIIEEW